MRTLSLAALLLATGCGSKTTIGLTQTSGDTGSWWDESDTSNDNEEDDDDDDTEDEDDTEEDDDDTEEDDTEEEEEGDEDDFVDEAVFWGELETRDGEGAVGYFSSTTAGILCEEEYELTRLSTASGCTECSAAYELAIGEREVFEESGSSCSSSPFGDVSGTTLNVGISGEEVYLNTGSGWQRVATGYAETEGSEVFFEISREEEEDDD